MAHEERNQSFQGFKKSMKYSHMINDLQIRTSSVQTTLFPHLHTGKLDMARLFSQPPKTFASHEGLPFSVSPEVKGREVIKYSLSDQK